MNYMVPRGLAECTKLEMCNMVVPLTLHFAYAGEVVVRGWGDLGMIRFDKDG